MAVRAKQSQGFTLIELMVVLVILAFLAAAALPFAQGWVSGVRQSEGRSQLSQAVGHAEALALRNPEGALQGEAVSRLTVSRGRVVVRDLKANVDIWEGALSEGVEVLNDKTGQGLTCVEWDNRGAIVVANGCQHTRQARVTKEGQDALTVDLL